MRSATSVRPANGRHGNFRIRAEMEMPVFSSTHSHIRSFLSYQMSRARSAFTPVRCVSGWWQSSVLS